MQNDSIDNLRLDLNKKSVRGVIYVRQGDTRARTIHITLVSNGMPLDLSEAHICEILIHKPDEGMNDQAMVRYGNELQYTLRTLDIDVPGECHCQVMVTFNDGTVVTSPEFSIMVYQKTIDQEYEKSTNEYTALSDMVLEATELRNETANDADRAEAAAQAIEDYSGTSEAFAIGTRNGVPVDSSDPAYNNNSKYWSDQAVATLDNKVDKKEGKGLSTNDFTDALKDKLDGIETGAEVNVQSDWDQSDNTAEDYIKNKPTIPAAQIQSDWDQADNTAKDYIKNKPTLGTAAELDVASIGDASSSEVVKGDDTRLHTISANPLTATQNLKRITIDGTSYNISGGHTIVDGAGTSLAQEDNLQFPDSHVTDASQNNATVVENIKEVSPADYASTTDEGIIVTDDGDDALIGPVSDDYEEVIADGVKTWATLLNELYAEIDNDKVRDSAKLFINTSVLNLTAKTSTLLRFDNSISLGTTTYISNITISETLADCKNKSTSISNNTSSVSDISSNNPDDGDVIRLYYGKKAIVDLQTTANRCLMSDGVTSVEGLFKTVEYSIENDTSRHNYAYPTGFTRANCIFINAKIFTKYNSWVDTSYADGNYWGELSYVSNTEFGYLAHIAGNATKIQFTFMKLVP